MLPQPMRVVIRACSQELIVCLSFASRHKSVVCILSVSASPLILHSKKQPSLCTPGNYNTGVGHNQPWNQPFGALTADTAEAEMKFEMFCPFRGSTAKQKQMGNSKLLVTFLITSGHIINSHIVLMNEFSTIIIIMLDLLLVFTSPRFLHVWLFSRISKVFGKSN